MGFGAFTRYIDLAQVVLYAFWVFFFGLIWYLHRENKREGYPLESDRSPNIKVQGFPAVPAARVFKRRDGVKYEAPPGKLDVRRFALTPGAFPGAPATPSGNPLVDGVGPAAWAERADEPELTANNEHRIVPMRLTPDYSVDEHDPDPRGMQVMAADGKAVGTVRELWVDRSEPQIRFLEVAREGAARPVLVPILFCRLDARRREIGCKALLAAQFADVPGTKSPDCITAREEDRLLGYYGGGYLYATASRQEPLL